MLKKFFLLFTVLSCFASAKLYAQPSTITVQGYGAHDFNMSFSGFIDGENNKHDILGTPYISKDWMYGELVVQDTLVIKSMFRYNLVKQEIELVYKEDTLSFQRPLEMNEFRFMGKRFIYNISIGNDLAGKFIEGAYLEVLVDGRAQLLQKIEKYITDGADGVKYAAASSSSRSYQMRTSLYFRPTPDSAPVMINGKKRNIIRFFPDNYRPQLKQFVKSNNLRLSNTRDVKKLIEYFNSLN